MMVWLFVISTLVEDIQRRSLLARHLLGGAPIR